MNIFEDYKNKIISIIKKAAKDKLLILPENLNGVNADSTPPKIDFDLGLKRTIDYYSKIIK